MEDNGYYRQERGRSNGLILVQGGCAGAFTWNGGFWASENIPSVKSNFLNSCWCRKNQAWVVQEGKQAELGVSGGLQCWKCATMGWCSATAFPEWPWACPLASAQDLRPAAAIKIIIYFK